jgi:hypothetical protein
MKESDIKAKVDDFVSCLSAGKKKGSIMPPPVPPPAAEPEAPCVFMAFKNAIKNTPDEGIGKGPVKSFIMEVLEQIPLCEA